jgi:hypothetical protein
MSEAIVRPIKKLFMSVFCFLTSVLCLLIFSAAPLNAENDDLELVIDGNQHTVPLPKVFRPAVDISGRGLHNDITWPQTVAAKEVLDAWGAQIGFNGMYRIQYNLWEISQLKKASDLRSRLLANYESIIKQISDAGGTVIVSFYGTPEGLGPILDKKSPVDDYAAFKSLIKTIIRELSCNKRYSIWYEFWNAPDLDEFYLGRKQEYFNLYRAVAESVKELRKETKMRIPVGGPSISWWFQNLSGNTNATPEKSLIYELIKYCYQYRLPLDFISWHGYATDPNVEKEVTIYNKNSVVLVREWLSYFGFDKNTPIIIDEWNFDRDANVLPERKEKSFIAASYIPSRLKSMYQAGVDYQLYFCLEDFQDNREGVVRNVGVFYYDPSSRQYSGGPKSIFNVYKMLNRLGKDMVPVKFEDDFIGAIASRNGDSYSVLVYNYIDPEIISSYLSKNLALLPPAERKILLKMIKSQEIAKIIEMKQGAATVRTTKRIRAILKKVEELNDRAKKFEFAGRAVTLHLKNMKGAYKYEHYVIDSSCSAMCEFVPIDTRDVVVPDAGYLDKMTINPYSVHLLVFEKQPEVVPPVVQPPIVEEPVVAEPIKTEPNHADEQSQPEKKPEQQPE